MIVQSMLWVSLWGYCSAWAAATMQLMLLELLGCTLLELLLPHWHPAAPLLKPPASNPMFSSTSRIVSPSSFGLMFCLCAPRLSLLVGYYCMKEFYTCIESGGEFIIFMEKNKSNPQGRKFNPNQADGLDEGGSFFNN